MLCKSNRTKKIANKWKMVILWKINIQATKMSLPNHKCCTHLHEECPKHHGHKGDPGVTPETCGAIGERTQVILLWVRAPGILWVPYGVRILECSRIPQSEVWARRYGNLSGAMSRDIALVQQWHGSGSRNYQGLNMHNFLNSCPNGASA